MSQNHYQTLKEYEFKAFGVGILFVVLVALSCWVIKINGAVTASGVIAAQGQNSVLQHPDGGRVVGVNVSDGDVVSAGDILLQLDDVELLAEARRLRRAKLELEIRIKRFAATLNGDDGFSVSRLRGRNGQVTELDEILGVQHAVLLAEKDKLKTELSQTNIRARGAKKARVVLTKQRSTNIERMELIESEIEALKPLVEDKLVPQSRMTRLQREKLDIQQRLETIDLEETRLSNNENEARIDASFVQKRFEDRLWKEKEAAEGELADISRSLDRINAQLGRLDVVASIDGRIHEIAVTNAGSFIGAGEVILQIVPNGVGRQVRVRLGAADIDDVTLGQSAKLRFDTFRHLNMPEIEGIVVSISPDRIIDEANGLAFFNAVVEIVPEAQKEFDLINPEMGVPVTVLIETHRRSLANYLLAPVGKSFGAMFQES